MIADSYEAIANFNKNKDLINLIKMFNENYIMIRKKVSYDKINKLILENKNYLEQKQKRVESKINETNTSSVKSKILLVPDDENDYLRQQNKNLKERNDYLLKENEELKENISKNFNDISSNNNNIMISKINLGNIIPSNSNINFYTSRNQKHLRIKTAGDENILYNNIRNQNILKNNLINNNNNNNLMNNSGLINESEQNITNNNIMINNNKNILPFNKTNTNSFYDCNLDEIVNSHSEMFSIIGNNTSMINDKFLLETTELGKSQNGESPGTPTLTPRSNIFDIKDENNSSCNCMLTSSSKLSDLNSDSANNGKNNKSEKKNNSRKINKLTKDLKMEAKKSLNVNNFNNNKFSFAAENNIKNYYDFKYLFLNRKIAKLLLYNNEKVKSNQLFSDQIFYILNGNKKKKGVLLITYQCFYILDEDNDMNCELRISHKLLSSISIPNGNFNHLLIYFSGNCFIIIEIYRRIHLLNYLKELYSIYLYKNKKIDIYFCDNFNIKINNQTFLYEINNNKNLSLTPNFENAKKMGLLKKYKENIFSGYFSDKLVVLCSIGLLVFSKSNINVPKLIIPIIGSTIKQTTANANERYFCFTIKTMNNELFIFGSNKIKEIKDWIQELKNYQKVYETKMKEVISNFIIHPKNIKK